MLPLIAAVIVLIGLLALGVGRIGTVAIGRARAQAAADAAALAGARDGRGAAERYASANGATVVAYTEIGADVRVSVRVSTGETAIAQARPVGASAGEGPSPAGPAPAPAMRAVLARAAQVIGHAVTVDAVGDGGLTVSLPVAEVEAVVAASADAGLCPAPALGPTWFGICGPGEPSVG